ncbi:hypothetical protein AB0B50_40200 [Streptomyces sp. NPDC041068]|uniref:hypothetical protein n=1 Tax=Streptomyces sp. NPDC041068 TaxID=3155130 RepID=UPI0033E26143
MHDNISNSEDDGREARSLHSLFGHVMASVGSTADAATVAVHMPHLWSVTLPEVRQHLLLVAAWEARTATAADVDSATPAGQYAWAFIQYASAWAEQHPDGDAAAFCAGWHPARHATSSLAFDRDDFLVPLETALLLCSYAAAPEEP